MSTPRILIVEDDADVSRLLSTYLQAAGYAVSIATDGAAGLAQARANPSALTILDLMLPTMPGLEVCKLLKHDAATGRMPIIILSAMTGETDRIVGLELGADDYVTKPFSPRELVLRVKTLLRAGQPLERNTEYLRVGDIELDRSRLEVKVSGRFVGLTATEFKLLALLAERCGRLQSRDALLEEVWEYNTEIATRTIDTHIRRLRRKLGKSASSIETIRSFGYRMTDAAGR